MKGPDLVCRNYRIRAVMDVVRVLYEEGFLPSASAERRKAEINRRLADRGIDPVSDATIRRAIRAVREKLSAIDRG